MTMWSHQSLNATKGSLYSFFTSLIMVRSFIMILSILILKGDPLGV